MTDWPLRSLSLAGFRRVEGPVRIPLNAPIVLIHGPNGTGKTSLLSALEMALTGRVAAMERQNPHYTAHLPHTDFEYATVQVDLSESIRSTQMERMTVGGSQVNGVPALDAERARFFSERCYLDQSSLGRLLELYQTREEHQETMLAKFVNELLGLEHLDALRAGLQDANDLRNLKRLAPRLAEGDEIAKKIVRDLNRAVEQRREARGELQIAYDQIASLLNSSGRAITSEMTPEDVLGIAENSEYPVESSIDAAVDTDRGLATLLGRIRAVAERPSTHRVASARAALESATARLNEWRENKQPAYQDWLSTNSALNVDVSEDPQIGLSKALARVSSEIDSQRDMQTARAQVLADLSRTRQSLQRAETLLNDAQAQATTLVEGLATLRNLISGDICPVCDRDYGEVDGGNLEDHLDAKISHLAKQGDVLVNLRVQRDQFALELAQQERRLQSLETELVDDETLLDLRRRERALEGQQAAYEAVEPIVHEGITLVEEQRQAREQLEDVDLATTENRRIDAELTGFAQRIGSTVADDETPIDACLRLMALSAEVIEALQRKETAQRELASAARRLRQARDDHVYATARVAELGEARSLADARMIEARRRQRIARDVHDAASAARTTIVQEVFTESLNKVWADIFKRLAPQEKFIPAFGVPTATKSTLEVALETQLRSGQAGGPPELMLSAGNLNTAALSLFLALHLAVTPLMPCLVFDDPVQAMDEVHVAQFAALIRSLSKQHERQVVIAVHERELFNYLALELSPAFDGDSLITVELGERSQDPDKGITEILYRPDAAITG